MKISIKVLLFSLFVLINYVGSAQESALLHTDQYTWYPDKIIQGDFVARAISDTEMQSDYQSQATAFKSPRITFKFSINGLDNEMLPGINHEFVCLTGNCETPIISFGNQYVDQQMIPANTYLKPNTILKIRLDMRSVFAQFEKTGYYTNFNGVKIYKADFKAVYVVGNTIPMVWNFDNLTYHKDLELTDPDGDGIYEVLMKINPKTEETSTVKTWKLKKDISAFPRYQTSGLLENAIYNMSLEEMEKAIEKDSTLRTGIEWPGVWTRDVSYSIILSMAYLQPKVSENSLMRKVNANGRIIQDTGTGGAWPVSTDRMIWAVAAWEIYKVTGDRDWLRKVYPIIKNSIEDDILDNHDARTGLVKGESSFLDWREQTYPRWMQPTDIYESECLGTNAVHYQANIVLAEMANLMNEPKVGAKHQQIAQQIKAGINQQLWLSNKGYYGQYLYGRNFKTVSPRAEALGEALCVWFDIANKDKQQSVITNVPVMNFGISCIYPQIPGIPPYHNNAVWPFVQTYWALASAKAGNEKSLLECIAAIYRPASLFLTNKENFVADNGDFAGTQINSSNMLWSLSGNLALVQRVLFGIEFGKDSIFFHPCVPKAMAGNRSFTNFKYRNAVLDIRMEGYGNQIQSFELDGKVALAALPYSLSGKHFIKIILANQAFCETNIHKVPNYTTIETPVVSYNSGILSWTPIDHAKAYVVLKNGESMTQTTQTSLKTKANGYAEYQVLAVDSNQVSSFASEPMVVTDAKFQQVFEIEKHFTKSNLNYKNYEGEGFVEISKTQNRIVTIPVNVSKSGIYTVCFRYANGNGPINTENKCAIRTLKADGKFVGTIILPQRGTNEWSNWGNTNFVQVKLSKGKHSISMVFEPQNENMNGDINQAMIDKMVVYRLD